MPEQQNSNFAIRIRHDHYNVKRREEATEFFHIANDAEQGVKILKQIQDPSDVYKYAQKLCITDVKKLLTKHGIVLLLGRQKVEFNKHHFQQMAKYFGLKDNSNLCFKHKVPKLAYTYSYRAIEFIIQELRKDPANILNKIKDSLKKRES